MSHLDNLLLKHRETLESDVVSVLDDLRVKLDLTDTYAWPPLADPADLDGDSCDHAGFAKIERVFSSTPVDLYGQDVGALSLNRLTIYRPDLNGAVGEDLISLHLSDQALTNLMLLTNSGRAIIPGTVVSLGGETLPTYRAGTPLSDVVFQDVCDENAAKMATKIIDVADSLSRATNARARKIALDDLAAVQAFISSNGEMSFYLDERLKSYGAKRIDLVSEVSQAAFHADHIIESPPLLTEYVEYFDSEDSRRTNPMINSLLGTWSRSERKAVGALVTLEMQDLCKRYDVEMSDLINTAGQPSNSRDLPSREGVLNRNFKEEFENIKGLMNEAFNIYVSTGHEQKRVHQVGLSLTQFQGNGNYIHSSLPSCDTLFTFSIGASYEKNERGLARRIGSNRNLISIEMTADDLMMMVRGTMNGAPVPCSLKEIAGQRKAAPKVSVRQMNKPVNTVIEKVNTDDRKRQVLDLLQNAQDMVNASASKEDLAQVAVQILNLKEDLVDLMRDGFNEGDVVLKETVAHVVREDFKNIHKANPHMFQEIQNMMSHEIYDRKAIADECETFDAGP